MSQAALLLQKDLRGVARDGMLAPLVLYPWLLALAGRFGTPFVPLEHVEFYLAPALAMIAATMLGTILGFGLVEEREQRTWLLLRVVPLSSPMFFGYAVTVSAGFGLVVGAVAVLLYGLAPADPVRLAGLLAVGALGAPLLAFALGALASNKLAGFALAKGLSSLLLAPGLVFVVPATWQWTLWWNPFYWLYVGMLEAWAGPGLVPALAHHDPALPAWSHLLVPLCLCLAGIVLGMRAYRRRAA